MNWGKGIVIAFALFIGMIFTFIYLGSRVSSDLVAEDYYARELAYEEVLIATRNTASFKDSIQLMKSSDGVRIKLPAQKVIHGKGSILFFRMSDEDLDKEYPLHTDEYGNQLIPFDELKPGKYQIKIQWQQNGVPYYWEKDMVL